jgi:hypothetical protein
MKTLNTQHGSYLTGNEIADAVMHYALVLSKERDIDIVDVPFLSDDGVIRRVQLTIGWQIGTTAISTFEPADELLEADTILSLNAKAKAAGRVRAQAFSAEDLEDIGWPTFDGGELG